MCVPVRGPPTYATLILENLKKGNVSDKGCADVTDLGDYSLPFVRPRNKTKHTK